MGLSRKAALYWLPMMALAILNGAARDLFYKAHTGELAAHQLSTLSLLLVFALYIPYALKKIPVATSRQALTLGTLWLIMTLCFEFGIGLMAGKTWGVMLADYNLASGRVWVFIPLWVLLGPLILKKRGNRP